MTSSKAALEMTFISVLAIGHDDKLTFPLDRRCGKGVKPEIVSAMHDHVPVTGLLYLPSQRPRP